MKDWSAERIAAAAGARLAAPAATSQGPERVTIDSRDVTAAHPPALFAGLSGQRVDGGRFAGAALAAGAWGVLVDERHAAGIADSAPGAVLAVADPLAALQRLATAWRRELGASVIGVTGSTGKTSTKDILLAVLAPHRRTFASRANFNTEIGLPLEILAAPAGTEVLVLEMGMRGAGQIAELARIAEPDVGVIVSVGPVHLELLGSVEAIAEAKAELLAGLPHDGGVAVIPAGEPLLEEHVPDWVTALTFGEGGDVRLQVADGDRLTIAARDRLLHVEFPFPQAHLRSNLLAAVAAADAVGVVASGQIAPSLSAGRGQRVSLPVGATLIDDCYNANPMSMRAALDDLSATSVAAGARRRVAVLGDMLELGPDAREFHLDIGHHADAVGVDLLVAVGPLSEAIADAYGGESYRVADARAAAAVVAELVESGDMVLVKASRGVGLEKVCEALR